VLIWTSVCKAHVERLTGADGRPQRHTESEQAQVRMRTTLVLGVLLAFWMLLLKLWWLTTSPLSCTYTKRVYHSSQCVHSNTVL